eukprot:SAG31_NODE_827_length_11749_cov_14.363090_15_plen_58_part_01
MQGGEGLSVCRRQARGGASSETGPGVGWGSGEGEGGKDGGSAAPIGTLLRESIPARGV